jgi:AraC-like DNA-binding protein
MRIPSPSYSGNASKRDGTRSATAGARVVAGARGALHELNVRDCAARVQATLPVCMGPSHSTRESTVSIHVVRGLFSLVEKMGVPREQLHSAAQISPERLELLEARMPRAEVYRLCELAIELTGDPALGLHWIEHLTGVTFSPVSLLITHSPTLRIGLESVLQFHRLLSDQPSFELLERDDLVVLRAFPLPGESPAMQRFSAETHAAGLFKVIRLFRPQARLRRVSFQYEPPSYRSEYTRTFEGLEHFDQPFTGIVFDKALLDAASPHQDEGVHGAMRSIAEERRLRLTEPMPYAVRVREQLVQRGLSRCADMAAVARALGLSARSLRRRLDAEGKTFTSIAKEARGIVAQHLLRSTQRTIQEVAYEMGFADASTFHRAFKSWTGMTPSAFRNTTVTMERG